MDTETGEGSPGVVIVPCLLRIGGWLLASRLMQFCPPVRDWPASNPRGADMSRPSRSDETGLRSLSLASKQKARPERHSLRRTHRSVERLPGLGFERRWIGVS